MNRIRSRGVSSAATALHCNAGATLHRLNIDRLLRDVESRLAAWDEAQREEAMDVLRAAPARGRAARGPPCTLQRERERRQNAEELRDALEAIHSPVRPSEALDEALKQLERVVPSDFAVLAVA